MSSLGHRLRGAFSFSAIVLAVTVAAAPAAASQSSGREAQLLSEYLTVDSSDETGAGRAIAWLHRQVRTFGLQASLIEAPSGCRSLVARLPATASPGGRPIVLLHHADVVAADAANWKVPPFQGRVEDGMVWGRGAIDAKGLGVAQLLVLEELRTVSNRRRDVLLVATCDEERGGQEGAGWLIERYREWFPPGTLVLNEGGSNRVLGGDGPPRLFSFGVEVAQKRPLWLRVRARGRGGHGSMPWGNPVAELVRGLQRLDEHFASVDSRLTRQLWWTLRSSGPLAGSGVQATRFRESLDSAREVAAEIRQSGRWTILFPPATSTLFSDTMAITHLEAGSGVVNVIPKSAEALVDVRMLPDTDEELLLNSVREILGSRLEVEVLLTAPPVGDLEALLLDSIDWQTLRRVLGREAPVHPVMIGSTTDSRYFRAEGVAAYGFSPFVLRPEYLRTIHGADERIPIAVFLDGVERLERLLRALVAPEGSTE